MGYMLMQVDDSPQSVGTIYLLEDKGECTFDLSLDSPPLRSVLFGSQSSHPFEIKYHSFVSEVVCGRWKISCCRKYFWGITFYWIFNCIAVKEILEYTKSIHHFQRWSYERFDYEFAKIHRAADMMKDLDDLSLHIYILIHRYFTQASSMRLADITLRPFAYSFDSLISCSNPRRVTTSDITITTEWSSTLPYFASLITLQLTLLLYLFFIHILFQTLFQISLITWFLLKTLYGSILTQLLPLSIQSFLFGQEELPLTSRSK